jgi:hypothetical protein
MVGLIVLMSSSGYSNTLTQCILYRSEQLFERHISGKIVNRIVLRRWKRTKVLENNGMTTRRVPKELYYGKAETLGDVEEVWRWWQYNLL